MKHANSVRKSKTYPAWPKLLHHLPGLGPRPGSLLEPDIAHHRAVLLLLNHRACLDHGHEFLRESHFALQSGPDLGQREGREVGRVDGGSVGEVDANQFGFVLVGKVGREEEVCGDDVDKT